MGLKLRKELSIWLFAYDWCLLITYANSLDLDKARQNVP